MQRAIGEPSPGSCASISLTPNGKTLRWRKPAPSKLAIFSRNSVRTAFEATAELMISF
jgi:hypothetical protein